MKVTLKKTFVNENGMSFLKGRAIEVPEEALSRLADEGYIEMAKSETEKKPTKKVKKD